MGLFGIKKGSIISDFFSPLQDIAQFKAGNAMEVSLHDDRVELSSPLVKPPITLKYSQITDVYYGIETELVEKNKSTIGRAVAGGLLFGGAGAIVGAISGSTPKQKKTYKHLFIISYKSSSGEDAFLQFEDTRMFKGEKVANKLKELCDIYDVDTSITSL